MSRDLKITCDRCGEVYDKERDMRVIGVDDDEMDLCEDCSKDFDDFVKEGKGGLFG